MARRSSRKFTPYRPPAPPAGSYDPSLDAQLAAARRGLTDLQSQIGTQQARDVTDYAAAMGQQGASYGRAQAGLLQSYEDRKADLQLQRNRTQEDYTWSNSLRNRQFNILGRNQMQAANAAGVLRGGALLQAAARRAENQGIQQRAADTTYGRQIGDIDTAYGRAGRDYEQQQAAMAEDFSNRQGQLALDYAPPDANNPLGGRRYQDRTTQLTQAQREFAFFGQDTQAAKAFQASGSGWDPPQRPGNEFTNRAGQSYRVVREGNQSVAYLPSGRVLWKRPYRG